MRPHSLPLGVALSLGLATPALAQDFTVDPAATPDATTFNTLEDAIRAAPLGTNIRIAAGDYSAETLTEIGKTIQLIGLDRDNVQLPFIRTLVGPLGTPTVTIESATLFCPLSTFVDAVNKAPGVHMVLDDVVSDCADLVARRVVVAEGTGTLTVRNSLFFGSGTHVISSDADVVIEDSVFNGNNTTSRGLLFNDASGAGARTLDITRSTYQDFDRTGGNGGAIYVNAATARFSLTDSLVHDNLAASGGGIYVRGGADVQLARNDFMGNNTEAVVLIDSTATLDRNSFVGNQTGLNAIGTDASTVTVSHNRFRDHTANAVIGEQAAGLSVFSSHFCGNDTDLRWAGGAISIEGSTFALGAGSNAISAGTSVDDTLFLQNVTFAGYADAAIFVPAATGYTVDVRETIFHDLGGSAVHGDGSPAAGTGTTNNLFAGSGWASGQFTAADFDTNSTAIDPEFQGYVDRTTTTCDTLNLWLDPGSGLRNLGASTNLDGTVSDVGGYGGQYADLVDADGDNAYEDIDCDETDPSIHPRAVDVAHDGIDQDCNGVDNLDGDGDGHDADFAGGDDCDDDDPAISPSAVEIPHDGIDQDCDGFDVTDVDGDGYDGGVNGDDCDDQDPAVNPGATEVWYDGVDSDCDGWSDYDQDFDGYDSAADGDGDDCDDTDDQIHPSATDLPDNEIDEDCDGSDATSGGTGTGTGTSTGSTPTGGGDEPKTCNGTGTAPSGWLLLSGLLLLGLRRRE